MFVWDVMTQTTKKTFFFSGNYFVFLYFVLCVLAGCDVAIHTKYMRILPSVIGIQRFNQFSFAYSAIRLLFLCIVSFVCVCV